jgi:hypothetical protein
MSIELIIVGGLFIAAGIILNHFFPNKYWTVLVAVGVIILIVGLVYLLLAPLMFIAPPLLIH